METPRKRFLACLNQAVHHRPSVRVPICIAPNHDDYRQIVAYTAMGDSHTLAARINSPAPHSRRVVFQSRSLIWYFRFALRIRTKYIPVCLRSQSFLRWFQNQRPGGAPYRFCPDQVRRLTLSNSRNTGFGAPKRGRLGLHAYSSVFRRTGGRGGARVDY